MRILMISIHRQIFGKGDFWSKDMENENKYCNKTGRRCGQR